MNGETLQGPLGGKPYVAPKDWAALTVDEKIERMREQVKHLSSSLGYAQTQIHNLRMKLKRHDHKDGKVMEIKEMQDYDDSAGGLVGSATLPNDKFF